MLALFLVGCDREPAHVSEPDTAAGHRLALNLQAPSPAYWGDTALIHLGGAQPNEQVYFARSFVGLGSGPCPAMLGGLCIDLAPQVTLLGTPTTDPNGAVNVLVPLPDSGPPGATLHVQVAIPRGVGGVSSVKTGTVSIPVENRPFAVDDTWGGPENTLLVVPAPGILANDGDLDGDTLTPIRVTAPQHGNVIIAADGSLTYDPDNNFSGTDSFTYQVDDGGARSEIATVTFEIDAVNGAPTARTDNVFGLDEDTLFVSPADDNVLLDDTDPEGDPLTAVLASQPPAGQGAVALDPDGSFTWTPSPNFEGETTFSYHAFDGTTLSPTAAVVTLHIQGHNDAPSATGEVYATGRDQDLVVGAPGLLANDSDVDGPGPIEVVEVLTGRPDFGTLALGTDGSFTYVPDLCTTGPDTFLYKVGDTTAAGKSPAVTVTVNVGLGAPLDPAFCDAFQPVEDDVGWDVYLFEGFETTSYVPANPVGLAFLFHGSGGDVEELGSVAWTTLKNELVARGMALVATESTNRASGEWEHTSNPVTNDDFPRLERLRDHLVATTAVNATTPVAAVGFSNGGGFVPDFADMALQSGWPMSVMSIHNANGNGMPNLPAFFVSSENDTSAPPASMLADYNAHPAAKEYHEHREGPVHPMLFVQHVEFDHQQSQDHFDALVAAGGIDASGVRLVSDNQMEPFLNGYEATATVNGAARATSDVRVVWAMHRVSATFAEQEADFVVGHL